MQVAMLLTAMSQAGASDLHLKAGAPPILRVDGVLRPMDEIPPLDGQAILSLYDQLTTQEQKAEFGKKLELDFSYHQSTLGRFRVNASRQRGSISLALRRIALEIPSIDELLLPAVCKELALRRQGLILLTGPTGSGKSTTLAAMIDHINHHRHARIVTVEDPIEYIYHDDHSLITQREIGRDTHSFAIATRQALRQDPDVILVGEMRDRETMAACLTAAETGHLVMSTLHTNSGPQTIDRIVDTFADHQQNQIRMQLSLTLLAALSQSLLPRLDARGRLPAVEVMLANSAIRNLIREGKTHQMESVIQTGRQVGMQTMDQALQDLYRAGHIDIETATAHAHNADTFRASLAAG
jgi:twitching motility protein PilT